MDSQFYQKASNILGYDIRAKKEINTSSQLLRKFEIFDSDWTKLSKHYGFHLTIGDSIDFDVSMIIDIQNKLSDIVKCFNNSDNYTLTQCKELIPGWENLIVLRYDPSGNLKYLHSLVTTEINTLGTSSVYTKQLNKFTEQHHKKKIKLFNAPFVLSDWKPHFTLFNPIPTKNINVLKNTILSLFCEYTQIIVKSVCLVIQENDNEYWQILKEYKLNRNI